MMNFINMFWTMLFNSASALNEVSATVNVMATVAHAEAEGFSAVQKIERDARTIVASKKAELALKEATKK